MFEIEALLTNEAVKLLFEELIKDAQSEMGFHHEAINTIDEALSDVEDAETEEPNCDGVWRDLTVAYEVAARLANDLQSLRERFRRQHSELVKQVREEQDIVDAAVALATPGPKS